MLEVTVSGKDLQKKVLSLEWKREWVKKNW